MSPGDPQEALEPSEGGSEMTPEQLLDLLEKQLALYQKLKELAGRQRELVSEEDPAALLTLLGERQQLLDRMAELDARIGPVRRDWECIGPELPGTTRRRATAIFQESRQLLESVLASDREDTQLLEGRRSVVQEALRTIGAARQAHAAYGSRGPNLSKYFDTTDQES